MKDTLTKKEVDSFFASFKTMIQDLINCIENIQKILHENQTNYDKISCISPFLNHYVNLCYSHCVLTISKLFVENEKRSFKKFLSKLENLEYDTELRTILKENQKKFDNGCFGEYDYLLKSKAEVIAEALLIKQEIVKIEDIINKVKIRRDSYYAHYDPSKQQDIEVETLSDLKICLELSETIYERFFGGLLNTTFMFNICDIEAVLELAKESHEKK